MSKEFILISRVALVGGIACFFHVALYDAEKDTQIIGTISYYALLFLLCMYIYNKTKSTSRKL